MNKSRTNAVASLGNGAASSAAAVPQGESIRESVEAVIVAIILTLTFRTFLGENYQIPTGSMAPTLQGRHVDVVCDECGYQYRTGAAVENDEDGPARGEVTGTTCPICRFPLDLDKQHDLNQRSFGGDRIIVSKLAYAFSEPQRWDVFVFKYPGNPKINYIKRLVGLPGETLRIRHGDLFTLDPSAASEPANLQLFRIARKPAEQVTAMLQLVDDTNYRGPRLREVGWPSRWSAVRPTRESWKAAPDASFSIKATSEDSWLGYRHLIPGGKDWEAILNGIQPDLTGYQGQLITDYYEYNDFYMGPHSDLSRDQNSFSDALNWVGDLAVEAKIEVASEKGELLLDIVEGGIHHRCRIDVASGRATLAINNGQLGFRGETGPESREISGQTTVRGRGTYVLRFANVDDQLFLWVNQRLVAFDGPTTFDSPRDLAPKWTEQEPGDLVPLRIGARQAECRVTRLRVLRDVHYVAVRSEDPPGYSEYGHAWVHREKEIYRILANPRTWSTTNLFASRREVTFELGPDQFFPMGDNSPFSKDGRLWSYKTNEGLEPPPYVRREMLIGKALCIYWPHSWNFPRIPFIIPNYQRMSWIR